MRTAINKKRIVLYAVCAFFFCLAGVFQAVDSSLPDFWHALFALLAHTILISLVVAWGISLIHRMVRKDLRAYFLTVAVLILFFLVLRVIKIAMNARDNVGYLMCGGIAVMLFAQILVNVGMELSLLPCIGITLPLFSAGGSSSLCIYLALGIEYSVYRFSRTPRETLFYTK